MKEIKVGEVWKDIEDFSNYQISNFGRVKSKERITNVGIKNVKQITMQELQAINKKVKELGWNE